MARIFAALAFVAVALTLAPTAAHAAPSPSDPATREFVAKTIAERLLFSDVTSRDRREYLKSDDCYGDGADFALGERTRRYACYLQEIGVMGGTADLAGKPTFAPQALMRRDQMASVVTRLAAGYEVQQPERAGFIDVSIRNVHRHAIGWAALHGLIDGYDTRPPRFKPARAVSRRQVVALTRRVADYWARYDQN